MRRTSWLIILAIPLVLVIGDIAYWRITVAQLRSGFQEWLASRNASGWQTSAGAISIGGWPRAATIHIPDLVLRHDGAKIPGKISIAMTDLALSVSLFNPANLHMSLAAPAHVRIDNGEEIIVSGEEISASNQLNQTGPLSMTLHARSLRAEPAKGGWRLTVGLLNGQTESADDQTQSAATFTISAEAIALPENIRWPLGTNISSLSMDGRLNGLSPVDGNIRQWAENWRDGGGSLEITHFAMGWGPLGVTSSATLALDDQLQPMGSGNGRIVGYADTLDRLAAGGMLSRSAATAAKAILSLLAGTSGPDEPSSVDVPLTLQYRTLSMRQVPLVRLPELDWPTP